MSGLDGALRTSGRFVRRSKARRVCPSRRRAQHPDAHRLLDHVGQYHLFWLACLF